MTDGKAISGGDFYPPPAAIWNNMIDAGRAWADNRLNNGEGQPIRPRETDIIKLRNTSGASRRLGEVLKIEGKAITTVSDEHIWLLGVEPTADCYFGILKRPMLDDEIDQVQVSGCCIALIDIQDVDHRRADIVAGEYVLPSSNSGPIEILYAPESTGEQTCVVRFAGGPRERIVILDAALPAALNSKTGATSALATICNWNDSTEEYSESSEQLTVWNHSESANHAADTFGSARFIDNHWLFFGDCEAMASR